MRLIFANLKPGPKLLLFVLASVAMTVNPAAAAGEKAPTQPDGLLPDFEVTSGVFPSFERGGLIIETERMRFSLWGDPDAGTQSTLNLRIDQIDESGPNPVLRTVVTEYRERLHSSPRFKVGEPLPLEVSFDPFGRLKLKPLSEAQLGQNQPTWLGARPTPGWPQHDDIPADQDAGRLGILGPWAASQSWPARLGPDELRFGTKNWQAALYDIIEWTPVDGEDFARLDTDYVEGYDQRLIGQPVPMLLRRVGDGYAIAFYPPEAGRPDDWPTSFTYSPDNPVQVIEFAPAPN